MKHDHIFFSFAARFAQAALICAALSFLAAPCACYATESVFVTRNFNYAIKGLTPEPGSFKADDYALYFTTVSASGARSWHRVQLSDGAAEVSGEDFTSLERPGLAACLPAGVNDPKDRAALKNMVCDGAVLFAAPVEIDKKKYHAAIASDWHLYLFAYNDLFKGRSFPVHKTPIGAPPLAAFYSGSRIFAVTDEFVACFRVAGTVSGREARLLAPSIAGLGAADAIRSSIEISDGTINDFDCAVRYARSSGVVYRKLLLARNEVKSSKENFIFLVMGFGYGNANIYSTNADFSFTRLTNFSGTITDFKLIDGTKPLFSIIHSPDPLLKNPAPLKALTLAPPSSFGTLEGVPLLKRAGRNEMADGAVFSTRPSPDGNYFKLLPSVNGGEFIIETVDECAKTVGAPPVAFSTHGNLTASWPCPAAISSNPRRTMVFFYDGIAGYFRVYDARRAVEHDSFRYDLGGASIEDLRFSFDNELVMFRVRYPRGANGAVPDDTLFVYRVINKTLMKVAAHRTIGDFDCVKYANKRNIVLIYADEKPYCNSIGFITVD